MSKKITYAEIINNAKFLSDVAEKEFFMRRLGFGRRKLAEDFVTLKLSVPQFKRMTKDLKDEVLEREDTQYKWYTIYTLTK